MNIQKLAQEYQKLEENRYFFGIENGEHIELRFLAENFYHLLGFQKFEEATIVKMIKDEAYYKERFYKNVLDEEISFNSRKITFKNEATYLEEGRYVHFSDVKESDRTKMVINNRFPYFTYDNIMDLFNSELIVLYDKEKGNAWNKIEAEKIFFKFMTQENRNLNLFIKYSKTKRCEAPVSFFLEEVINSYLLTGKHCVDKQQEKASITYMAIQNKDNNVEFSKYEIYWDRVRYKYSKTNSENYVAEKKLHNYFYKKGNPIKSYVVKVEFQKTTEELEYIVTQLNEIQTMLKIEELKSRYIKIPETDENMDAAIELLETYEIDIQIELEEIECDKEKNEKLVIQSNIMKNNITKLKNKIKKIRSYLPKLSQLEKEEVIYVYKTFLPQICEYEDDFFIYLIDECRVLEKNIKPREIQELYRIYKHR